MTMLQEELGRYSKEIESYLATSSGLGVAILDSDLTILDCNPGFMRLFSLGRKPSGEPLADYLKLDDCDIRDGEEHRLPYSRKSGIAGIISCRLIRAESGHLLICERVILTESRALERISAMNNELINLQRESVKKNHLLANQTRLASLRAEMGAVLGQNRDLREILKLCCELLVENLDVAFFRIWTLNEAEQVLEMQASAGMYTHINGSHSRVPVGMLKIGRIALERQPHLSNDVLNDPRIGDREWAQREGMVAFAGYPLIVADKLVGVMGAFARTTLTEDILGELASISGWIAQCVERKRAEETVAASHKLLQTIINTVPMRVFWKDTELRYLGCNLAFAAEAGAEQPDDLIGKDDYQLGWKEQTEKYRADDRSVIESGVPKLFYDEQQITPDGQMIWVRTSKVPFRNEADETIGILGIFNDITEYKLAEESLRESNERFAVAFNKAPIIYTICSLEDGKYLDVNQRFVDISGFSRDEAIGKTPVELGLISRSDQEQRLYLIQRDGKIDEKELSLYTKSGKLVLCKYWSENITVAGRKCLLNIDLDITENRKLEQQFIQAQKMELVGQLAGGVAHDFNNMLHIIIGHAEMALLKTDPSQPLFSDLEQIRKSAYRSADLTRQLLAFARKQTILPKVLDLNETVAGMLKMLQRLIGEDISLIWRPAAKLWQVEVDPSQIDQIVANICVNARDAISGVGKITIESVNIALDEDYCAHHPGLVTGEYVRLTVSDDGCGMDKETLSHIFEPFFTTKGVGEGTGLGLATVYGAVKQNNGFIYTSSELGAGTTFTIYLPRYVGIDVEARTEVAATPVLHGQETILLVEDEPGIIFISTQMLEMLGYTVLAANSPDEAIHLAREYAGEIHLLLTDVIMPKMNGLDLAKNLLSAYPHMKLLFMSGYTADVISHQCLLLEGGYFIQKPISMQDLAAKVREVLNGK